MKSAPKARASKRHAAWLERNRHNLDALARAKHGDELVELVVATAMLSSARRAKYAKLVDAAMSDVAPGFGSLLARVAS